MYSTYLSQDEINRIQERINTCYRGGTIIEVINDLDKVLSELKDIRAKARHNALVIHMFRESY